MNKSNNMLYLALLVVSLIACGFSFCFSSAERGFAFLTSIGCSGIVSVLVAWLIERTNERIQKKHNGDVLNLLLREFDSKTTDKMQQALYECARWGNIDLDRNYSIIEIRTMLDKLNSKNTYFKYFTEIVENNVRDQLPTILLNFDKSSDGIKLCSAFKELCNCLSAIQSLEDVPNSDAVIKFIVLQCFHYVEDIYKVRNKKAQYCIPDKAKPHLMYMRTHRRKEVATHNP